MKKAKIIEPEVYKKFDKIREIRNKYIHSEGKDGKRDSLKVLKIFIEFLNEDFKKNFIVKEGKIFSKNQPSIPFSIIVPEKS